MRYGRPQSVRLSDPQKRLVTGPVKNCRTVEPKRIGDVDVIRYGFFLYTYDLSYIYVNFLSFEK